MGTCQDGSHGSLPSCSPSHDASLGWTAGSQTRRQDVETAILRHSWQCCTAKSPVPGTPPIAWS